MTVHIVDKDTGEVYKTYQSMTDAEADQIDWQRMYPNGVISDQDKAPEAPVASTQTKEPKPSEDQSTGNSKQVN